MPILTPMKKFRDAVHGDIYIYPHELLVINTQTYQRLHNIRQLDLAYKVFHDAVHTRFEHLIGATHIAQQILRRLKERGHFDLWKNKFEPNYKNEISDHIKKGNIGKFVPPEDVLETTQHIVRLATLLHDVTHIPFGHMLENQLGFFTPHDSGHRLKWFLKSIILDISERFSASRQQVDKYYSSENIYWVFSQVSG